MESDQSQIGDSETFASSHISLYSSTYNPYPTFSQYTTCPNTLSLPNAINPAPAWSQVVGRTMSGVGITISPTPPIAAATQALFQQQWSPVGPFQCDATTCGVINNPLSVDSTMVGFNLPMIVDPGAIEYTQTTNLPRVAAFADGSGGPDIDPLNTDMGTTNFSQTYVQPIYETATQDSSSPMTPNNSTVLGPQATTMYHNMSPPTLNSEIFAMYNSTSTMDSSASSPLGTNHQFPSSDIGTQPEPEPMDSSMQESPFTSRYNSRFHTPSATSDCSYSGQHEGQSQQQKPVTELFHHPRYYHPVPQGRRRRESQDSSSSTSYWLHNPSPPTSPTSNPSLNNDWVNVDYPIQEPEVRHQSVLEQYRAGIVVPKIFYDSNLNPAPISDKPVKRTSRTESPDDPTPKYKSRRSGSAVIQRFIEQPEFRALEHVFHVKEPESSPEPTPAPRSRRKVAKSEAPGKKGGRRIGMHLNTHAASAARQMRETGSCWVCCLQREKCDAKDVCQRCTNRHDRGILDTNWRLGCDRTKMQDLTEILIPGVVGQAHQQETLRKFQKLHMGDKPCFQPIDVDIVMIWHFRRLRCTLGLFDPLTDEIKLVRGRRYHPESKTLRYHETLAPAMAIPGASEHLDGEVARFTHYVESIALEEVEKFAHYCYADRPGDGLSRDIFKLVAQYSAREEDLPRVLENVLKLMVAVHIFTHQTYFHRTDYEDIVDILPASTEWNCPGDVNYVEAPRMVNRQIKAAIYRVICNMMHTVLEDLQRVFRGGNAKMKWTSAFCAMFGLAMGLEELQCSVYILMSNEARQGNITQQDGRFKAAVACKDIDEKYTFAIKLFQNKYGDKFNPLSDLGAVSVKAELGENGLALAKAVDRMIKANFDWLYQRQLKELNEETSQKVFGRLVARFLLSSYMDKQF